ncbi:hypothetical protein P280DRAFT_534702 [Massarina eburnea CBS 473.64]|uniref:Uncharacterized protein n=1 Tax=Massarina eburnea CBS 473.64 TaxID=1395130 RepID=A0A6A6RME8_9PLEO|nr:hypothetical protein P280DRAFT_534702 [Massarina eburnea CBS 473.64]
MATDQTSTTLSMAGPSHQNDTEPEDISPGPHTSTDCSKSLEIIQAPTVVPLSAFAKGWGRLPDELKLKVVSYIVPAQTYPINKAMHDFRYLCDVQPYVGLTPEITNLALETYYSANTFATRVISKVEDQGQEDVQQFYFQYPARSLNHFVRRMSIRIEPLEEHWDMLHDLSTGHYGLKRLVHLSIHIDCSIPFFNYGRPSKAYDVWMEKIHRKYKDLLHVVEALDKSIYFKCAGEVGVSDLYMCPKLTQPQAGGLEATKMGGLLRSKIVFNSGGAS